MVRPACKYTPISGKPKYPPQILIPLGRLPANSVTEATEFVTESTEFPKFARMFTGIIESLGTVHSVDAHGTNKTFWIASSLSNELKVDQSLSHNGVCLTVEEIKDGSHRVTAIEETLKKTNLDQWHTGDRINLERCLVMNGRLDGHIVQGHADTTATCLRRKELQGSWEFRFEFPGKFSHLVIEKGSIGLNGISLTVFNVKKNRFDIAVIPYTFEHTNVSSVDIGAIVNLEFDLIGKYVTRFLGK